MHANALVSPTDSAMGLHMPSHLMLISYPYICTQVKEPDAAAMMRGKVAYLPPRFMTVSICIYIHKYIYVCINICMYM
jgi:hypothetical protein